MTRCFAYHHHARLCIFVLACMYSQQLFSQTASRATAITLRVEVFPLLKLKAMTSGAKSESVDYTVSYAGPQEIEIAGRLFAESASLEIPVSIQSNVRAFLLRATTDMASGSIELRSSTAGGNRILSRPTRLSTSNAFALGLRSGVNAIAAGETEGTLLLNVQGATSRSDFRIRVALSGLDGA